MSPNSCDAFVFADDIFLLFSADKGCETILENNINVCLNSILQWTSSNSLTINPLKTKAIRFTSNEMVIHIFIGQTMVQFLDQHKCLGVIIDRRLNFGPHIDSVHARVYGILRRLYSTCFYFPKWIKFRIAYALLMPLVSYALEVISGTVYYNVLQLKCIVNSIIRYVYNIRRRDHVSPFVKQFLGLPFERYIDLRNLLFFYKIIKTGIPLPLCDMFKFTRSTRNTQIVLPRIFNSQFEKSFIIRVARCWNFLPVDLRIFSHSNNVIRLKLCNHLTTTEL